MRRAGSWLASAFKRGGIAHANKRGIARVIAVRHDVIRPDCLGEKLIDKMIVGKGIVHPYEAAIHPHRKTAQRIPDHSMTVIEAHLLRRAGVMHIGNYEELDALGHGSVTQRKEGIARSAHGPGKLAQLCW